MSNWKKEVTLELAQSILKAGYRVFIAESGTYGFFTDQHGDKIVSFQLGILNFSFSGNYKTSSPRTTGTGWRIDDEKSLPILKSDFDRIFNTGAPQWALRGAKWRYTTLEEHLNSYQWSSKYTELKG